MHPRSDCRCEAELAEWVRRWALLVASGQQTGGNDVSGAGRRLLLAETTIFARHACCAARSERCAGVRSRCTVRSTFSSPWTSRSPQSTQGDRPGRIGAAGGALGDPRGAFAPQRASDVLRSGCFSDQCGKLAPRGGRSMLSQDVLVILQELSLNIAEGSLCIAELSLGSAEHNLHAQDATFRRDFGRSSLRSGKCAACLGWCPRRSDSSRRCRRQTRDELGNDGGKLPAGPRSYFFVSAKSLM